MKLHGVPVMISNAHVREPVLRSIVAAAEADSSGESLGSADSLSTSDDSVHSSDRDFLSDHDDGLPDDFDDTLAMVREMGRHDAQRRKP